MSINKQGFVKIWRLSGELSTMASRELEGLDRIAAIRTAEHSGGGDDGEAEEKYEFDDEDFLITDSRGYGYIATKVSEPFTDKISLSEKVTSISESASPF